MGTVLQKRLAKKIVENAKRKKPLNKGELLESAGYDPVTAAASPGRTLQQKGVKEELVVLGFDEKSAMKVVKEIMLNKKVDPAARLKATDQVFKVQGTYAPEKKMELHAYTVAEEDRERIDKILEDNE